MGAAVLDRPVEREGTIIRNKPFVKRIKLDKGDTEEFQAVPEEKLTEIAERAVKILLQLPEDVIGQLEKLRDMTFSCKIKLITTISSKKIQEVIEAIEEAETLAYLLDERFTEDIRDILKRVEGL